MAIMFGENVSYSVCNAWILLTWMENGMANIFGENLFRIRYEKLRVGFRREGLAKLV